LLEFQMSWQGFLYKGNKLENYVHKAVLLEEAVKALITRCDGSYVDCTYGRGGHSRAIALKLASAGRLLVLDADIEAISHARNFFTDDSRVVVEHSRFSKIRELTEKHEFRGLDGVLLDLGVSSPQLDNSARGFSFQLNGPLDMRFDSSEGTTAAEWLRDASEKEIEHVLKNYGEERFSRRISRALIAARDASDIETTKNLSDIVVKSVPSIDRNKHPATRVFQAIRIQINQELNELSRCLEEVVGLMNSGGRIVVISFHSLEDRIVKHFFKVKATGDDFPRKFPIKDADIYRPLKIVGKPVKASEEEIQVNRRSRSAIMRVAEKMPC